jgi:hypothetical protein
MVISKSEIEIFCDLLLREKSWKEIVDVLGSKKACEILEKLVKAREVIVLAEGAKTVEEIEVCLADDIEDERKLENENFWEKQLKELEKAKEITFRDFQDKS